MSIFDLTLLGPLHQGEFIGINREAVLEWIPSDSLFAALVASWAQQGIDVATRLAGFFEGQSRFPFLLSSAFPRAGKVRFFPAPPRLPQYAGLFHEGSSKATKKIRWISSGIFKQLQAGQTPETKSDNFIHGHTTWLNSSERQQVEPLFCENADGTPVLWHKQIVPHVTVDRQQAASNLFHSGRVVFSRDCGVWFAARGQTEWISKALPYLSDAGIGGLRSTGHGCFTSQETTETLPEASSGWGLCLSRYIPASQDEVRQGLQADQSAYRLTYAGGWFQDDDGHAWRRRSVRMVAEGALLPAFVCGQIVDVRPHKIEEWHGPQHPVYRCGLAWMIPAGKLVEGV